MALIEDVPNGADGSRPGPLKWKTPFSPLTGCPWASNSPMILSRSTSVDRVARLAVVSDHEREMEEDLIAVLEADLRDRQDEGFFALVQTSFI